MTSDRARGWQLYALAVVLLLAGGAWFLRSAPYVGDDPRVLAWRATVARELPDLPTQAGAGTLEFGTGEEQETGATVQGGSFTLSMLCAGVGQVRVRLSSRPSNDSGQAIVCADRPEARTFSLGLGTSFYLSMESESSAAIFRWRLIRSSVF